VRISRGSLATRRHGAVPWRDGATAQPLQPWSSYARESHAPSNGGGGWVGRYAWASNCPDKRITALWASSEYSRFCANPAKPSILAASLPLPRRTLLHFGTIRWAQTAGILVRTRKVLRRRESSSSVKTLLRMHRVCIVKLSSTHHKNMSVFDVTSHVFTSSGATQHFGDNAAHSMLPSVLVSAPFTTEFSGVTPQPWIEQASANRFPVAARFR
jgi:hypothetical protein